MRRVIEPTKALNEECRRHGVPMTRSDGSRIVFAHSHYVTNAGIHQPWGRATAYCYDYEIPEPVATNGNRPARVRHCASVSPARYSMTRNGRPSCSPKSRTRTTFG